MFINGVIAVIVAYLIGSIPWSYIITRLYTGRDIRRLGAGNAGTFNVLREIGFKEAALVTVLDIGKGAAAVFIIPDLMNVPLVFILAAGLAAVAGHLWPLFLRFKGSTALAPTMGVLSVLMTRDLVIALAVAVLLIVLTRNPVLSLNASLFSLPLTNWLFLHDVFRLLFLLALALMLILHYMPIARAALAGAGSRQALMAELFRIDKGKQDKVQRQEREQRQTNNKRKRKPKKARG